jgi:hypothetical protein
MVRIFPLSAFVISAFWKALASRLFFDNSADERDARATLFFLSTLDLRPSTISAFKRFSALALSPLADADAP